MQRTIRWAWAMRLALACALCVAGAAQAQRMEGDRANAQGLYAAEVAVTSQSEPEREAGYSRALALVLAKLSGHRDVASQPGVARELERAGDYVERFDYRQDEGRSSSGAPTYGTMLVVHFKPDQIDAIAVALGLPIWPEPRPKPVLWLAIDDGTGPRLVALAQSAVARSVLQRAVERGFRLGLPSGTAAEQAAVGAIWRGDVGAIARLSSRYNPPMQLIGKLYLSRNNWVADWTFVDDGTVLSKWSERDSDARQVMATGADGAAEALAERYATRGPSGPPGKYRVVFTGIDNGDDFIRLAGLLQGMPAVRGIIPVKAAPDRLDLELDLVTGLVGFRSMVDASVLREVGGPPDTALPGSPAAADVPRTTDIPASPGIPATPAAPAVFELL